MNATVGDRVRVQPPSLLAPARFGTVEAVLSESPSRYQIRWDTGRWSIISTTDGSLRVVPTPKRSARRRRTTPTKQH